MPFGNAQPSHGCEGCGLLTRWQSLAEARRQMDGARATTYMQLNEIQTTANSEPELEFPSPSPREQPTLPTAAAARTDGLMHPSQRALQPSRQSSLHARNARPFA